MRERSQKIQKRRFIIIHSADNVATAITGIEPEELLSLEGEKESDTIRIREKIHFGHKFAIRKIHMGDHVIKYGEIIGRAVTDIDPGFHVHVHNVESLRGRGDLKP